jgi:glycosyltransferase involved in cell wall biosynthesis
MMREGDKRRSYEVLADAMNQIEECAWSLVIIGDGPARLEVERAFANIPPSRVIFAGVMGRDDLPACYSAADIMVWPAVNEAYGMAMLEAQAAGLPVVAGRTGGVPDVVRDEVTGVLCPVGDSNAFAGAVAALLDAPARRERMRRAALSATADENDITVAARQLGKIMRPISWMDGS